LGWGGDKTRAVKEKKKTRNHLEAPLTFSGERGRKGLKVQENRPTNLALGAKYWKKKNDDYGAPRPLLDKEGRGPKLVQKIANPQKRWEGGEVKSGKTPSEEQKPYGERTVTNGNKITRRPTGYKAHRTNKGFMAPKRLRLEIKGSRANRGEEKPNSQRGYLNQTTEKEGGVQAITAD